MRKFSKGYAIKTVFTNLKNEKYSFDYPIQRAGGQWTDLQKSLLIHSIACDYPVPPIYALGGTRIVGDKEKQVLYILDGKQRLTNIESFLKDEFRLDKETPTFIIDDEQFELAEYKYSELPDKVKESIELFSIDIVKLEDALDEEIEDVFYRLNNGTSLTQQQKAKAKLGKEMALRLKNAMEHPMMLDKGKEWELQNDKKSPHNVVFTELQRKQAQDEVALVQSMMLIDDSFEVGKFGTKEVSDYTASLRDSNKDVVLENLQKALDLLHEVLGEGVKEKQLLKKINFPFVVYASHKANEKGLSAHTFKYWIEAFKAKLVSKENGVYLDGAENPNAWLYKIGSGAGATKAEKVAQRLKATQNELENFYKELEEEMKEEEKARLEIQRLREEKEKAESEKANEPTEKPLTKAEKRKLEKEQKAKEQAELKQGEQGSLLETLETKENELAETEK